MATYEFTDFINEITDPDYWFKEGKKYKGYQRGKCQGYRKGQTDFYIAQDCFNKAIKKNSNNIEIWYEKIEMELINGSGIRSKSDLKTIDQALTIFPNDE